MAQDAQKRRFLSHIFLVLCISKSFLIILNINFIAFHSTLLNPIILLFLFHTFMPTSECTTHTKEVHQQHKVTRITFVAIFYKFLFRDTNIYIFSFRVLSYFD